MFDEKYTRSEWVIVEDQEEFLIGINLIPKPRGQIQSHGRVIARVPKLKAFLPEQEANAQLIVNAAEMFSALKSAQAALRSMHNAEAAHIIDECIKIVRGDK